MGAFFTNVQLKTSDLDKAEITENIIAFITKFNTEVGFIKVGSEEEADKTVIVLPSNNSNWVAIYDEEIEDQDLRKLNKLSSELSKEFKTTALSVLVNDSDSIYVGLNINGILKDTISNLSKEINLSKNKPHVWTEIFVDNYTFDNIKFAWQNKSVFVEEFLAELAKFVNLDNSKLLTGYNYINEENRSEGIKLNFAQKDKKKTAELGLTKFSMLAGAGLIAVKEGENQIVEWILTNHGTFSTGVEIVIAGKCIEQGLLIPKNIQANYVNSQFGKKNEFTATFVETVATTGEKIFYAKIEDIFIPKGFQPTYPMSPKERKRYGKISYDCAIKFNIRFIGGKEGGGDLSIFISPIVNRQEGSYCASITKGTLEEWMKKNAL